MPVSGSTIPAVLDRLVTERPHAEAVVFPGARMTFGELSAASVMVARSLRAAGIGPRDLVGVLMPASVRNVELLMGIWRLGAIPVPFNPRYKPGELAYGVDHSGIRLLLCDREGAALAEQAGVRCRTLGEEDLEREPGASSVDAAEITTLSNGLASADDAIVLYTSGTTSKPKGAIHSHASLVAAGRNVAAHLRMGPDDRFWSPLPMFHCGGFNSLMSAWGGGGAFCHPGAFDAGAALDQLERERCTIAFPAFETIWLAVLDHPRCESTDLSALRIVINVGVPERLRQMQERMPGKVQISTFGCTESCGHICIGDLDDPLDARATTAGRVLAGMELRIVDPATGDDAAPGEPGEALFRGASRFSRYLHDPEHTADVIDRDGWYHSGDLMSWDGDGRASFIGRLRDMLKVGGENVSPAEVEGYLLTHPAVRLVQVVGAPDARYVEVACAFVQLAPEARATDEELIDYCLGQISTFKVPRYVRFVTEWPMSGTKIQKFRLRERIAQELREAGITEAPRLSSKVRA